MSKVKEKKSRRAHDENARGASVAVDGDAPIAQVKPRPLAGLRLDASRSEAGSSVEPGERRAAGANPAVPAQACEEPEASVRLHELKVCLSRRYKEIELLTGLLAAAEGERDDLRGQCEATTSQLLTMQHERNCLAAELSRAQAACSQLQSALDTRDAALHAITSSRSWRMTWPMRRLRQWAKD